MKDFLVSLSEGLKLKSHHKFLQIGMVFARKNEMNRVVSTGCVYFIFHAVYMKGKYVEQFKTAG